MRNIANLRSQSEQPVRTHIDFEEIEVSGPAVNFAHIIVPFMN